MMAIQNDPFLLLATITLLGVLPGLLFWPMPGALKVWALLVTMVNLLILLWIAEGLTGHASETPFIFLLPLSAFLAVLGQNPQKGARAVLVITLILLGLGLGSMAADDHLGRMFLTGLLSLLGLLIYRYGKLSGLKRWWGLGIYGLGIVCVLTSLMAGLQTSRMALLLASGILLPLFPFHGGHLAALTGLPGTLPAFLAVLLPSTGFQGLLRLLPDIPVGILPALLILGVLSAAYASFKALLQFRMNDLVAYASLALFAILWWYLATTRLFTPQAGIYFSAVALVVSGLFLAWHAVQARYGDFALGRISGLAYPMPRFATLLSLLVMAAMGLPLFGLFPGYMEMLFHASSAWSGSVLAILFAWLMTSWYFLNMMQRMLFGPHRSDIHYEDLRHTEVASLLIVLLTLAAMGTLPYGSFMEFNLWK